MVPLTTEIGGGFDARPIFEPDGTNGLKQRSCLMTNRIAGMAVANVGDSIGVMASGDMERVDAAMMLLLGL